MADSVDRVFVHALNTVKRIRSARPPPADRLKLYGLYKQSMEGNVEGVMDRPQGDGANVRADQDKWEAWRHQRGLSRTEAKRKYISTLIETMHQYASQTPDARELVSELEFVWDQIKSNPPSSSSSNSLPLPGQYPSQDETPPESPTASKLLPGTYPTPGSDERGATTSRSRGNRSAHDTLEPPHVATPLSQSRNPRAHPANDQEGLQEEGKEPTTPGPDVFVDAPDSQPDYDHDNQIDTSPASQSDVESNTGSSGLPPLAIPPLPSNTLGMQVQSQPPEPSIPPQPQPPPPPTSHRRDLQTAAGALIAPFAAYITKSTATKPTTNTVAPPSPSTSNPTAHAATLKWQRRIETSLIKLTTELAALREQLEMQQQRAAQSSSSLVPGGLLPNPFRRSTSSVVSSGATGAGQPWQRKRWSIRVVVGEVIKGVVGAVVRVLLVDAAVLACLLLWMRWKGYNAEFVAETLVKWIRGVREGRMGRGVRKVGDMVGRPRLSLGRGWLAPVLLAGGGVRFLPRRQ